MEGATNSGKDDKTPLTDSEAVEHVIEILLSDTVRLKTSSEDEAAFFAIKASLAMGYSEPMAAEQRALNSMLTKLKMNYACSEKLGNYTTIYVPDILIRTSKFACLDPRDYRLGGEEDIS